MHRSLVFQLPGSGRVTQPGHQECHEAGEALPRVAILQIWMEGTLPEPRIVKHDTDR